MSQQAKQVELKFRELMKAPLMNIYSIRLKQTVFNVLSLSETDVAIDVGCGNGATEALLSPHVGKVIGIDISEPTIKFLNSMPRANNVDFAHIDATKDPPVDFVNKFDKCICIDVLEHVENPLGVLHFVWKTLKSGGVAAITVPINKPEHGRNHFTQQDLYNLLTSSGFRGEVQVIKLDRFGWLINRFYGKVQKVLSPPVEADKFEETTCFEMMQKQSKIHKIYQFGIVLLFKMSQNSQYRKAKTGTRVLIVAEKRI